jgi:hypothetical protein
VTGNPLTPGVVAGVTGPPGAAEMVAVPDWLMGVPFAAVPLATTVTGPLTSAGTVKVNVATPDALAGTGAPRGTPPTEKVTGEPGAKQQAKSVACAPGDGLAGETVTPGWYWACAGVASSSTSAPATNNSRRIIDFLLNGGWRTRIPAMPLSPMLWELWPLVHVENGNS